MITYIKSDIFEYRISKPTSLIHIVNDTPAWGKGFVLAINKHYPIVKMKYLDWARKTRDYRLHYLNGTHGEQIAQFKLGQIQICQVTDKLYIINMVAQSGHGNNVFGFKNNTIILPPLRLDSLRECLYRVREFAEFYNTDIIGPKFGSGLAGGNWDNDIAPMIDDCLESITVFTI